MPHLLSNWTEVLKAKNDSSQQNPNSKKPSEKDDFLEKLEQRIRSNKRARKNSPPTPNKNQAWNKLSLFLLLILVVFSIIAFNRNEKKSEFTKISYSEFIQSLEEKKISRVLVVENQNLIEFQKDGVGYSTRIPYTDLNLMEKLIASGTLVESEKREESQFLLILLQWLPWIVIMLFFWFIISRQLRGRGSEAFNFGKSKAQMINHTDIRERFSDVKGCSEAVEELRDVVSFLKNPRRYARIGAKIPKGVLLYGLPGTGKTLLARAVAGEANVPFFSMSGSDFVEMFVGVGASRVRDLFETGKKNAPCIIFIDEIDAVGRSRGAGYGGGHDEREQTLNQLLVEMDGFKTDQGVILMAATNRSDVLDNALLRPGRFDRRVAVDVPDLKGRQAILQIHAKKVKMDSKIALDSVARSTAGFTGADLANLINEAALMAAKDGREFTTQRYLELAKDKVMLGSERRSIYIDPKEKKNTAYHEAGHALISLLLPLANKLHKVTIIPRGRALGVTHFLPEDGKLTMSRRKLEAELRVLYGGRVAEEIIFKDITNGAVNDIERATDIAKAMVCEWGFSRLGAIYYSEKETTPFGSYNPYGKRNLSAPSPQVAQEIDLEVKRILEKAYKDTRLLLRKNVAKLKKLAEALLNQETMAIEDICKLLNMKVDQLKAIPSS